MPFFGFQALTGNQYFKPSPPHIVAGFPDKVSLPDTGTLRASAASSLTPSNLPESPSEPLSPDRLVDILLSGRPSAAWDAVTKQLVHEQVVSARIQAQVKSMAMKALAKMEANRLRMNTRRLGGIPILSNRKNVTMHAISIIKRRRKKMNKHKFEKRREQNRGTLRANKEALRKKGQDRQKQV